MRRNTDHERIATLDKCDCAKAESERFGVRVAFFSSFSFVVMFKPISLFETVAVLEVQDLVFFGIELQASSFRVYHIRVYDTMLSSFLR